MAKVFDLIHNLTHSERRYLHVHFHFDSNKSYVELFNFLIQQDTYDEIAVKQHFEGNKWIDKINSINSYLFRKIMEGLRSYYRKEIDTTDFWECYANAQIFNKKGMPNFFKQEKKRLQSIVKKKNLGIPYMTIANGLMNWSLYTMGKSDINESIQKREKKIDYLKKTITLEQIYLMQKKIIYFNNGKNMSYTLTEVKKELDAIDIKQFDEEIQLEYDLTNYYYYVGLYLVAPDSLIKAFSYIENIMQNSFFYSSLSLKKTHTGFVKLNEDYVKILIKLKNVEKAKIAFEAYKQIFEKYQIQPNIENKARHLLGQIQIGILLYAQNAKKCIDFFNRQLTEHLAFLLKNLNKSEIINAYGLIIHEMLLQNKFHAIFSIGINCFNTFKIIDAPQPMANIIILYIIAAYETDYKFFPNELKNKQYWLKSVGFDKESYFKLFFSMFRRLHQRIEIAHQLELLLEYQQKFADLPAEEMWIGINDLWLNGKIADLQAAVEKDNNTKKKELA